MPAWVWRDVRSVFFFFLIFSDATMVYLSSWHCFPMYVVKTTDLRRGADVPGMPYDKGAKLLYGIPYEGSRGLSCCDLLLCPPALSEVSHELAQE